MSNTNPVARFTTTNHLSVAIDTGTAGLPELELLEVLELLLDEFELLDELELLLELLDDELELLAASDHHSACG